MIVYENSLNGFINDCSHDIANIIKTNMSLYGVGGGSPQEMISWNSSLPKIGEALDDQSINKDINVAVEYKIDSTKSRIDFMLYGKDEQDRPSMVIVELKQWSRVQRSNKPNYVFTYSSAGNADYFHPSYQAYRYKNIIECFNEYVQDNQVNVQSCAYLHNMSNMYDGILNNEAEYPFVRYSYSYTSGEEEKLREFVRKNVCKSSGQLLYEIDNSRIRPSKYFSEMLYRALEGQPLFTLDDNQATAVSTIVWEVKQSLEHKKRKTIIIKGGPGTGKSVVAINAMGQLIHPTDGSKRANVCYCTANFTPKQLFSEMLVNNNYKNNAIDALFKSSLASFQNKPEFFYDCIIVDEAHRAYQWRFGDGIRRSVDEINGVFNSSIVNVFFIDEDQIVTKADYLTIDLIKEYAARFNSEIIETNELKLSSQFRCLGGDLYIDFINSFLGYNDNKAVYKQKNYEFKVFDTPTEMYEAIKTKQQNYKRTRLLAGYTHDWVSKEDDSKYDFNMDNGNFKMKWNKLVNYSYINDETQNDRIGCIHTIQGVDMDYAGVIIGKDLTLENGKLKFNKEENASTDTRSGIRNAADEDAKRMIRNTYKVLLTRGIFGTYVYCEDKKLNEYLKSFLNK